jgi:hypothetical protein
VIREPEGSSVPAASTIVELVSAEEADTTGATRVEDGEAPVGYTVDVRTTVEVITVGTAET